MDSKMAKFLEAVTAYYARSANEDWLACVKRALDESGYRVIEKNAVTVELNKVLDVDAMRNILISIGYVTLPKAEYKELCELASEYQDWLYQQGYYDEEELNEAQT